jgi:hypothetical protein
MLSIIGYPFAFIKMSSLQVYGSSTTWFTSLLYTSISAVLFAGIYMIYMYVNEYIENSNRKINRAAEKLQAISRLNHIIEKKISDLEEKFKFLSNIQTNHSKSLTTISKQSNVNSDNILKINIELINLQKNVPDYVWIGYTNGMTLMVPNDIILDEKTINTYFYCNVKIIINHLKYLKNIREIKLDDFCINTDTSVVFIYLKDPEFRIDFCKENFVRNHINYIPNEQDATNRNYYINRLRKLRVLLFEMGIKLILNEDFENFIR